MYNVCTGIPQEIRGVLNKLLEFTTKEVEVREKTTNKMRYKDELIILGDNSKIKKELGYQPEFKLEQTLWDMFDYWLGYYTTENKDNYFKSYYLK